MDLLDFNDEDGVIRGLLPFVAFEATFLVSGWVFLRMFPGARHKLSGILFGSQKSIQSDGTTRNLETKSESHSHSLFHSKSYDTTGSHYLIKTQTGTELFSGTDSTIEISIIGAHGQTKFAILDNPFANDFENGQLDTYHLDLDVDVGAITAIILRNNGGGQHESWYPIYAEITHLGVAKIFTIHSWISSADKERIFFPANATLPKDVPPYISVLRERDLERNRQLYDYEEYNDLSKPDHPRDPITNYVTRCKADNFVIPADELFTQTKKKGFGIHVLEGRIPQINHLLASFFAQAPWKKLADFDQAFAQMGPAFPLPEVSKRCRLDVEFGWQRLAGVCPVMLTLVHDRSLFDELRVDDHLIGQLLRDGATINSEIANKRFFSINFRALLEPWLERISAQENHNACAPILILYRNQKEELVPIAISLIRDGPLYTPLDPELEWYFAKLYYNVVESGAHQLFTHWGRTHASTEPYVIATRRQLSAAHPVYKLLKPHLRYTIAINAVARQRLICAAGHIENAFFTGRFSMDVAADLYRKLWDFRTQSLPEDLKTRGVESPAVLPEYPYRDDGLVLWEIIEEMVTGYLTLYYQSDEDVKTDQEIQAWLKDIKTKGHPVKSDTFPDLNSVASLVRMLTTIIWVVSGHHAAVNFTQYDYSSHMLNYPNNFRKAPPKEKGGITEEVIMEYVPNFKTSMLAIAVTKTLSSYAAKGEEELIGQSKEQLIYDVPALEVITRFQGRLAQAEIQLAERDRSRRTSYPYLFPSRVPNSIAI